MLLSPSSMKNRRLCDGSDDSVEHSDEVQAHHDPITAPDTLLCVMCVCACLHMCICVLCAYKGSIVMGPVSVKG